MNLLFRVLLAPLKAIYGILCLYAFIFSIVLLAAPFYLVCEKEMAERIIGKLENIIKSAESFMKFGCPKIRE